jgi:hypothetical protein
MGNGADNEPGHLALRSAPGRQTTGAVDDRGEVRERWHSRISLWILLHGFAEVAIPGFRAPPRGDVVG